MVSVRVSIGFRVLFSCAINMINISTTKNISGDIQLKNRPKGIFGYYDSHPHINCIHTTCKEELHVVLLADCRKVRCIDTRYSIILNIIHHLPPNYFGGQVILT